MRMSITVTPAALNQMEKILLSTDNHTIRYELTSGGCGGLRSLFSKTTENSVEEGDLVWTLGEGRSFVIDAESASLLGNATIDYGSDAFMPSFSVKTEDMDACGCNESFAPRK